MISEQNLPSGRAKTSEQGWQAALQGLKELLEEAVAVQIGGKRSRVGSCRCLAVVQPPSS